MPRPRQAPTNRARASRAPRRPRGTAGAVRAAAQQRRRVASARIARRRNTGAPGAAPPPQARLGAGGRRRGGGWRARAAGGALAHSGDAAPGEAGVQPGRICAAIDGPAMRPRRHGGLHGGGAAAARCRGGAGDAAMRRSGRGGRRESPRFERGGRRELPQQRQRRQRSAQRSAQHHPPEDRARPARRPAARAPLPQADVPRIRAPAGAGAPRRRPGGVRAIQPRARRGAGAAMRLPAQRPRLPRGRACPKAIACPRAIAAGGCPGIRSPRGRGHAAPPTQRSSSHSASGALRRRRRHAIACPKAAPAQEPRRPRAPAAGGCPGIRSPRGRGRAAYSTRKSSSYSASGAARRRRRHAIACPNAAPARRPCLPEGHYLPKCRPRRRRMSGYPLHPPQARARRVAEWVAFGHLSLGRAAAQAPPCDCLPKGGA